MINILEILMGPRKDDAAPLVAAIEDEKQAMDEYQKMANQTKDEHLRRLYTNIRQDEKRHLHLLTTAYDEMRQGVK